MRGHRRWRWRLLVDEMAGLNEGERVCESCSYAWLVKSAVPTQSYGEDGACYRLLFLKSSVVRHSKGMSTRPVCMSITTEVL